MSSNIDLRGLYVPLITPFTIDDQPALADIERLAHDALDAGAAGIVALGTTGEPAALTAAERASVIDVIATVCRQRSAQMIVGAGTNSTQASIEAVRTVSAIEGVTALLSVVPYYTRPSEDGIVEHFTVLARESRVPLVVYNIPYRTGKGLGSDALLRLAATPNIAGVKQAVGGVDVATLQLLAGKPDDFHVLCGDDSFIFPMVCAGASGAIAASSNLCTDSFARLIELALKRDIVGARDESQKLLPLCEALFAEPSPSVPKGVLAAQRRIASPALRLPMTQASDRAIRRAQEAARSVVDEGVV